MSAHFLLKTFLFYITMQQKAIYADITFSNLNLTAGNAIQFTIAVKKDALNQGGINLFGANFGTYPQHIFDFVFS